MDMAELEITVERCREGDEDAWSALVSTTLRPIYRLCASYAPSAAGRRSIISGSSQAASRSRRLRR
jgi:hypothetical protein